MNALVGRRQFARTSRTPGKTRSVNFYRIQDTAIVDLPGYGYAKVAKEERNRWKSVIESYLRRKQVRLVVLLVDVRTGATPSDQMMSAWLGEQKLPRLVAVTKADKVSKSAVKAAVADVARTLQIDTRDVLAISATKKTGLQELWTAVVARVAAAAAAGAEPAPSRRRNRSRAGRRRRPSTSTSSRESG